MKIIKINTTQLFFLLAVLFLHSCSSTTGRNSPQKNNVDLVYEDEQLESVDGTPDDLGEVRINRKAASAEEHVADLKSRKEFPLVENEFVEQWIQYFTTGRGKVTFKKWMERSTRYESHIQKILAEKGLPPELFYLAMIESGFNPKAYSHAAASGLWQFISETGKRYGLDNNFWIDERRDFKKATLAATKYLTKLHDDFGNWYLAAAGYNAGEGKVSRALKRSGLNSNFWELCRLRKNFRKETRNYVPKIIAATLIARNLEYYGFDPDSFEYEEPINPTTVEIEGGIDIDSAAKAMNYDKKKLRILNAELRHGITPPGKTYSLKVPPSLESTLLANLHQLKKGQVSKYIVHKVRRGQTLGAIARRYRTRVSTLKRLNGIRNARRIRIAQRLRVPAPSGSSRSRQTASKSRKHRSSKSMQSHRVRRGENLGSISRKYGVRISDLKRWNNIRDVRKIYVGQRIKVRAKRNLSSSSKTRHKVRRGENLSSIATRYNTKVSTLMKINSIKNPRIIRVGQLLKVKD